ncbi:MAG: MOSC domain-containing protein [Hasllibacter sp.]
MRVHALWRHPIKGHGAERLERATLEAGATLPWDRRWAVADEGARLEGAGWAPCRNFGRGAKSPRLMAVDARSDVDAGTVTLTHPDRAPITVDPDAEPERLIDWARPLYAEGRPGPAAVIRAAGQGMTDADRPFVSLQSLASLRALSQGAGRDLDMRRFRGNLWLDGPALWEEEEWIGRRLRVGAAVLEVVEPIFRCRATEADPVTGRRDADTLGAMERLKGETSFGVNALVIEGGAVAVGDAARPS